MHCVIRESSGADGERLVPELVIEGATCTRSPDPESLVEASVRQAPDVIVYALTDADDLAMLRLLRRVAPRAGLVLVASADSLRLQRRVRPLRPVYVAVAPVSATELAEAVRSAVPHATRRAS